MGATSSTQHAHVLETSIGRFRGIEQRDLQDRPVLRRYTKIPYAQSPVGDLRWRRPRSLPKDFSYDQEGKPGDYTNFGPRCPQPCYNTKNAMLDNPNAAPQPQYPEDEDCLYLNIWVPTGSSPPEGGWPVQFFIHGGWLQVGDAMQTNDYDPYDLLAHSTKRVIVSATYRLNLFGYAAGADLSSETSDPFAGNYGFWDQRLALEWTHANIGLFGGNSDLITVAGLSAGSHSAFLQLYHDTYLPSDRQIIKQAHLISNAIAIQPNLTTSTQLTSQFDSLCEALSIPNSSSLSATEKVAALRSVPWQSLRDTIPKLRYHTFRASTDGPIAEGGFLPPNFLASIYNGDFATRLANRGTRIVLGEVRDEALLYKLINPPSSYADLVTQLNNYYPMPVVEALLSLTDVYDVPSSEDQNVTPERWAKCFSDIVADGQVHASMRGLVDCLLRPSSSLTTSPNSKIIPVPGNRIFRYRICWRAKGLDAWLKPEFGLCHAADTPIWWASGYRAGFNEEDKEKCEKFLAPFGRFLSGVADDKIGWGGSGEADEVRLFNEDGEVIEGWKDDLWERGLKVAGAMCGVQLDVGDDEREKKSVKTAETTGLAYDPKTMHVGTRQMAQEVV